MTVPLVAAATGSFSGTASTVCFIIGCFLLALAILFFFLFDIPGVFLLRTGKGVRKTIKKMKEINAQTGRLRNIKNDYMISQSGEITGETSTPTEPLQQPSQSAEGGNATTVLSPTETTLLQQSNETTVLSGVVGPEAKAVEYKRETNGRFDIVYNLMLKTSPVISVEYDNNSAVNGNYFKEERNATITVVEHNFNATAMNVIVNETPMQVTWTKADDAADTYSAEVPFVGDAHYIFSVDGKDFANNANVGVDTAEDTVAPWDFTVDKSSPKDLKISYEPTFTGTLLEGLTFGFYKAPVTVKLEATDDISGIDYFTYSYTVQEGASAVNTGKEDVEVDADGKSYITFPIPAQFRGFVSFTATNKSGVSASTADENAVVVDDIAPGVQVVYGNYDALNDKYYKANRTATITINEANFFAQDIEDGLLVITRKAVVNDGTITEETLAPQFTKIENSDKYVATIDFDQDADYTFDIKYTDRSGNVYDDYDADEFTVDKIPPKISIEKANGAYFNADRTAKITVVEHNFRASDFEFTAEAYNVLGKEIDLSSKDYQNYLKNQDNWTEVEADTWEAEITFDIEGNYTIGATYSDLAGNEQVEAISDTFCVDKSNPENLKITYDTTFIGTLLETVTLQVHGRAALPLILQDLTPTKLLSKYMQLIMRVTNVQARRPTVTLKSILPLLRSKFHMTTTMPTARPTSKPTGPQLSL